MELGRACSPPRVHPPLFGSPSVVPVLAWDGPLALCRPAGSREAWQQLIWLTFYQNAHHGFDTCYTDCETARVFCVSYSVTYSSHKSTYLHKSSNLTSHQECLFLDTMNMSQRRSNAVLFRMSSWTNTIDFQYELVDERFGT